MNFRVTFSLHKRISSKSQVNTVLYLVWPQHGTTHHSPSSTEVNKKWSYTSAPPLYLHGMLWGNLYLLQYHKLNVNFGRCPLISFLHKLFVFPPSTDRMKWALIHSESPLQDRTLCLNVMFKNEVLKSLYIRVHSTTSDWWASLQNFRIWCVFERASLIR